MKAEGHCNNLCQDEITILYNDIYFHINEPKILLPIEEIQRQFISNHTLSSQGYNELTPFSFDNHNNFSYSDIALSIQNHNSNYPSSPNSSSSSSILVRVHNYAIESFFNHIPAKLSYFLLKKQDSKTQIYFKSIIEGLLLSAALHEELLGIFSLNVLKDPDKINPTVLLLTLESLVY